MSTFFQGASGLMFHGGTFSACTTTNNISQSKKRGIDILLDFIAADALHDSADQYDAPKCHPRTRVAVLDDIMTWIVESESQDEFMMWLYGPAGAGKSAIARKIAELAAEKGLLIGTFFFSRASPTRSTQDRLVATLAYQLAVSIPETRIHVENAIERDPAVFKKSLQMQIDTLLMKPFQSMSLDTVPSPKIIIIDGLDECENNQAQEALLDAISLALTKHTLPVIFLVASRPETHLVTSFNSNEPLKSIHRRLALDDNYHPDADIRLFFSENFEQIRCTHRLRSTIPTPWPTEESLNTLVWKSSGQFIFAATVVRFVKSDRHRPAARLNIILGISPSGTINPFVELDALYKQILFSVDDIQLTLYVLSLYMSMPYLAEWLDGISEKIFSLEEGDIDRALIDLSSLVSYNELSGEVKILHASLVDFLSDPRRSHEFYINMTSARTDFACCIFQYFKGLDEIQARDIDVFGWGIILTINGGWILNVQLRNEILNFDLDAFITAAIKSTRACDIMSFFEHWMSLISRMGLEDGDEQLLMHQCENSFDLRVQKYQSDWRLQLLLVLAVAMRFSCPPRLLSRPRSLDIFLEMHDQDLHLVDQDALGLCHSDMRGMWFHYSRSRSTAEPVTRVDAIIFRYLDGDIYASAALYCMRFLSNPPKYSDTNGSREMCFTYAEWKETSELVLELLCTILVMANTSPEIMRYMDDHDINTTVKKKSSLIRIWRVETYILAFLARGGVCINWRIITAIRRGLSPTNKSAAARPRRSGTSMPW